MHEQFMKRCLELAAKGMGKVSPNPLVGSVIVHEGKIIGEGFHSEFGKAHAEVEAIQSVENKKLIAYSTLYVNLEPCNHFGKTPPCSDLILEYKIPEVIICNMDPNPIVSGAGIAKLKSNGVKVETGILEKEGLFLNRRFFTFHSQKRPYIILKWAQTKDGFIDKIRTESEPKINRISSEESHKLSHQWRSEESAILVGKNTVLKDNPRLTTRFVKGKNPIRIILDSKLSNPETVQVYNEEAKTIIINSLKEEKKGSLHFHKMKSEIFSLDELMGFLFSENIQSLIVEGGAHTLQSFIDACIWDEARIFTSAIECKEGIKAPEFRFDSDAKISIGSDELKIFYQK